MLENAPQLETIYSSVLRTRLPPLLDLQVSPETSHSAQVHSTEHQTAPPAVPRKEASQEACGKDNYKGAIKFVLWYTIG